MGGLKNVFFLISLFKRVIDVLPIDEVGSISSLIDENGFLVRCLAPPPCGGI